MRFKTTLMKDMFRYMKENGLYKEFKIKLRLYTSIREIFTEDDLFRHEKTSIVYLPHRLQVKKYSYEDEYLNAFFIYLYQNHRENFINLFEKFLKEHDAENYYNYVSYRFVYAQSDLMHKALIIKDYGNGKDNVYNNLIPSAFFMDAFQWAKTPQGRDHWSELNAQWTKTLCNFIMEGKYKTTI